VYNADTFEKIIWLLYYNIVSLYVVVVLRFFDWISE